VAVGVVLAAGGYPGAYQKGLLVTGLDNVPEGVVVFHAGTTLDKKGRIITNGGRVFNVISMDNTFTLARQKVYNTISGGVAAYDNAILRYDIAAREEA
jgi:phosphoribosylamine--glycine ligase